jgi:hypothetical protein
MVLWWCLEDTSIRIAGLHNVPGFVTEYPFFGEEFYSLVEIRLYFIWFLGRWEVFIFQKVDKLPIVPKA